MTAGNAFANPGPVIAGDVMVMIALVAVVVAAALWRPVRYGAALLAGAIIAMAAQAISAVIGVAEGTSPAQFGITPGQASQAGLTISSGLTPAFWIYCAFVAALAVLCARMLIRSRSGRPDATPPGPVTVDASRARHQRIPLSTPAARASLACAPHAVPPAPPARYREREYQATPGGYSSVATSKASRQRPWPFLAPVRSLVGDFR